MKTWKNHYLFKRFLFWKKVCLQWIYFNRLRVCNFLRTRVTKYKLLLCKIISIEMSKVLFNEKKVQFNYDYCLMVKWWIRTDEDLLQPWVDILFEIVLWFFSKLQWNAPNSIFSNKNEEICNKTQKHKNKRTNSEIFSPHCVKIRLRFSRQFIAIRCLSKMVTPTPFNNCGQ